MAKYKQPRRLNPVSFMLMLVALAVIYCGVQFGPPYWRKFRVKGVIKDAASRAILHPNLEQLQQQTAERIRAAGVEADAIRVTFKKGGGRVLATAEYVETINHPFVHKITRLSFRPTVEIEDSRAQ